MYKYRLTREAWKEGGGNGIIEIDLFSINKYSSEEFSSMCKECKKKSIYDIREYLIVHYGFKSTLVNSITVTHDLD